MVLQYRSGGHGYWVAALLPLALYLTRYHGQDYSSEVLLDSTTIILAIIIKYSLILTIVNKFYSSLDYVAVLAKLRLYNILLVAAVLTHTVLVDHGNILYEKFTLLAISFTFPYVFYDLIKYYPKSFTFGEAITVTQGFSFIFWSAVVNVPLPPIQFATAGEERLIILLCQVGLLAAILISRVLIIAKKPWTFVFMEEFLCVWAKCCFGVMVYRLDKGGVLYSFHWILNFFFTTRIRIALFTYWTILFLIALSFVAWTNYSGRRSSTMHRKYFHFLIVAVYLPGIFKDYNLLYLSSVALSYIFLLVELIRFLDVQFRHNGIGKWIDNSIGQFRDKQDEGELIITHIYLLVGCSLPIWLHGVELPRDDWSVLAILSGVLSVGIGDTFASIGGSKFGRTRIRGNGKSIEGTMCSILSQMVVLFILINSGLCSLSMEVRICGLVAILVNSIVEAKTDQIDNFILPLVTFNTIHMAKTLLLWYHSW